MDLIVLSLTYELCRCQVKNRILRMLLAAVCGSLAAALLLLYLPYSLALAAQALLAVPAMLLVAFGWRGAKDFLLRLSLSWFSMVVINGAAEALANLTGLRTLSLFAAVLVLILARSLVKGARASLRRQGRLYPVVLRRGEKSVKCLALYDSGNLLQTAEGEPVHIVSPGLLEELGVGGESGMTLIPFSSLGDGGWIRIVRIDEMRIGDKADGEIRTEIWLGKAQPELFRGKSYQMLLNGAKGVLT